MNSKLKISPSKVVIIIPTYNEVDNIAPVIAAIAKVGKKLPAHELKVLFVDDNSPDGTGREIVKIAKKYPFVKLLKNHDKAGLGHAYKKGMRYALDKLAADIIFGFDADLSHDPNKIPAFIEKIEKGDDLVLGSRYCKGGAIPIDWPLHRKFLSVVGNLFMRIVMYNRDVTDWTSGFRAMKKNLVSDILPNLSHNAFNGYTWQIGFLVKSLQKGAKVGEVPFKFVDRTSGHSKLGPEYIFNTLRYIMKVRLEQIVSHRIFKFAMVGGTGAVIQLVSLQLYRPFMDFQLAFFLAIETAIVSNFIWNNLWTFSDRKLRAAQIPAKFLTFNLASGGSILIQQAIAFLGERYIGLYPLFVLPVVRFSVDTGTMFAVTGILVGMFWNFFAYSHIIWKKKK